MTLLTHHDSRSDHQAREIHPGTARIEVSRTAVMQEFIRSALTIMLIMAALAGIVALKTEVYLRRLTSTRLPAAELIDSATTEVATAIVDQGQAKAGNMAGNNTGKRYG
jgi:hypothetical protein